jgi:phytoene dehydrogenase-like protein
MLAVRGATPDLVHHEIRFSGDYDAEFDDVFPPAGPIRDPTLYVSTSSATTPSEAPAGGENWFVLANAPAGVPADWEAEADRIVERLGVGPRVLARRVRSPADLERETGAVGGAIYGDAPHGRLGTIGRPGHRVRGLRNLWRVGGTAHPGGGTAARPARRRPGGPGARAGVSAAARRARGVCDVCALPSGQRRARPLRR